MTQQKRTASPLPGFDDPNFNSALRARQAAINGDNFKLARHMRHALWAIYGGMDALDDVANILEGNTPAELGLVADPERARRVRVTSRKLERLARAVGPVPSGLVRYGAGRLDDE
jgi:hypothetical protein